MKKLTQSLLLLVLLLAGGVVALSAQSCATAETLKKASSHAALASGEASGAIGASVTGSVQVVSAVTAVPLWMSGAVVATSASVVAAAGDSVAKGGGAATHGADKLWDFATGDPAKRPALDRERCVPPVPQPKPARMKDPAPAEAFKKQL